ncbi:uncharacterized protein LOC132356562 [Balaenoptera ricei]|uniref:uncharacterized protein LOC132356562 n=1 Tax=Balaenoptera ricei TaxID=2746895 RepID=UPI0028BD520D|nr:uncharacterized protein LOC132356562 [Balaenoptera ricei]
MVLIKQNWNHEKHMEDRDLCISAPLTLAGTNTADVESKPRLLGGARTRPSLSQHRAQRDRKHPASLGADALQLPPLYLFSQHEFISATLRVPSPHDPGPPAAQVWDLRVRGRLSPSRVQPRREERSVDENECLPPARRSEPWARPPPPTRRRRLTWQPRSLSSSPAFAEWATTYPLRRPSPRAQEGRGGAEQGGACGPAGLAPNTVLRRAPSGPGCLEQRWKKLTT